MKVQIGIVAGLLMSLVGCVCCPHQASFESLGTCEVTTAYQRSGVVAILIGPELDLGWSKLANKLNDAGYAKVLRGSFLTMPILVNEAEKLKLENPEIRFVVIGYDMGTIAAREIAANLIASQSQVDQLIYLDPWTTVSRFPLPPAVAVTVVRSHGWSKGLFHEASDQIIPSVGHYDLPTHEMTVAIVTGRLQQSAEQVVRVVESTPEKYDPTHPPIPATTDRPGHLGSDWDFLLGPSSNGQPSKPKVIPDRTAKVSP